jgi:hypothetical protein
MPHVIGAFAFNTYLVKYSATYNSKIVINVANKNASLNEAFPFTVIAIIHLYVLLCQPVFRELI